ncbi:MAG: preprotein translocase subunit SecE [Frankiaceae bacterium]|jgi:preprotein translocase subunit SecE|nr:preprotein translocase subunit SecE [Frankiaceae bacterium]
MTDTTVAQRPVRKPADRDREGNWFSRTIVRFLREVVAEMVKVIWPTRKELVTYTIVVVVFVVVMITLVSLLDLGFGKLIVQVFG